MSGQGAARFALEPHHDGSSRYVSTLSPALGDSVRVRLRVPADVGVDRAHVRSIQDAEPAFTEMVVESRTEHETWWAADVVAHNPVTSYRFYVDGPAGYGWVNGTGWHRGRDVMDDADFRLSAHPAPPDWAMGATVYQVFPDRFARSSAAVGRPAPTWAAPAAWDDPVAQARGSYAYQLYGGDLDGVVEHLDHLVSLSVDVLYLTPVFPAGSVHRYDAASFTEVDPLLGGEEALIRLVRAAHARGIRVIGDLTTNHTGDRHEWFRRARADQAAPEVGFYYFRDHPDDYVGWLGIRTLPKLDWRSEPLREAFLRGPGSVVGRWLAPPYDLDGWRIDVANMTGRYRDVDEAHSVAREIRATMRQVKPDSWLIAEHGHQAGPDLMGAGWHGTMNYAGFTRPVWTWLAQHRPDALTDLNYLGIPTVYGVPAFTGDAVVASIREVTASMPWRSLLAGLNKLDSHDTPRFVTVVGGDPDRYEVGLALLFTMPGGPMVFAGAETGLGGGNGELGRIPLPWDRPEAWDERVLAAHRRLAAVRAGSVALRRGGMRWLAVGAESLTFERESPDGAERVLVHVARADHPPVELPSWWCEDVEVLVGQQPGRDEAGRWLLPAHGPAAHVWRVR
ncbi:MAG TPA: glycoside hydrolase family 13 protein [Actinotalea sp.]|nr:glycoside hydrolase family 13 protein [Actinotalea sp.]